MAPPENLQGASLLPLVRGEKNELREELFAEVNYHVSYEPQRCVRTRRWKYVRRYGEWSHPALANIDASPSKTWFLEHGLADRELPAEALYDLYYDPAEQNNLAEDPLCAEVLAQLRDSLARWMEETEDPILKGPIPPPPNAELDPPETFVPGKPDAG